MCACHEYFQEVSCQGELILRDNTFTVVLMPEITLETGNFNISLVVLKLFKPLFEVRYKRGLTSLNLA